MIATVFVDILAMLENHTSFFAFINRDQGIFAPNWVGRWPVATGSARWQGNRPSRTWIICLYRTKRTTRLPTLSSSQVYV